MIKKEQGVYEIRNTQNGKVYVGQVSKKKGFNRRCIEHKTALRHNKHYNKHLQSSWNKHGEDNFEFRLIEIVENIKELNEREQVWISKTWQYNYNIQPIVGSALGTKRELTEEAKNNISKANKSRPWTQEDREKLSKSLTGIKRSDAFKKRRREVMLNSTNSLETRRKISSSNKGRIFSKDHCKKISQSKLGQKPSIEAILKRKNTLQSRNSFSGSSKYKGVSKHENGWRVRICVNGKENYLGRFKSEIEAARKYDSFVLENLEGDNYLNFPK